MSSLGMACNFHAEKHALPAFMEMATTTFDDLVFLSCPPPGTSHCEESIAIIEKYGCRIHRTSLEKGFGQIRTRLIRESKADWVMIMDCDEYFTKQPPMLTCTGTEKYPEQKKPDLKVTVVNEKYDQWGWMHDLIEQAKREGKFAVRMCRRHWFGPPGDFTKPCQNFSTIPDWQLRLVANSPYIFYDPEVRIHERLLLSTTWSEPPYVTGDQINGPFFDHHHCFYKPKDPEKNKRDMEAYEKLDKKGTEGMWLQEAAGVKPE